MKIKKIIALLGVSIAGVISLSGCSLVKLLEKSLVVNYVCEGETIQTDTVTTFNNTFTPTLPSTATVPAGHKFFGWTALDTASIHYTDPDFETEFVQGGGLLHYWDVADWAVNGEVNLNPFFLNEEEIPHPYVKVGWYSKTSTSGLTDRMIVNWTEGLKSFLKKDGATDDQIKTVEVKGYDGNVATMGALVNEDGDVDVMIGVGNNINSTAGVSIIEKVGNQMMGGKSRYTALLKERPVARKVYEWAQTEESLAYLA